MVAAIDKDLVYAGLAQLADGDFCGSVVMARVIRCIRGIFHSNFIAPADRDTTEDTSAAPR